MSAHPTHSSTDPWANWGDNRDEFPVRDMRYRCMRCGQMKALGRGEACSDCEAKAGDRG